MLSHQSDAQGGKLCLYVITDSQFADFWVPGLTLPVTDKAINTYRHMSTDCSFSSEGVQTHRLGMRLYTYN